MLLLSVILPAVAAPADTLTLAEARRLSPRQLASRLLGAAGTTGDYREADVQGNGGLMIAMPGLNSVTLYKRPTSAGFAGLCEVEGVKVQFTTSRYDSPGDPPHQIDDWWKLVRFAAVTGEATDRTCAELSPLTSSPDPNRPTFFATAGDRPVDAAFALRSIDKAGAAAADLGNRLTCASQDREWPVCSNPVQAMRDLRRDGFHFARVERCSDTSAWCVSATWFLSRSGNGTRQVDLLIHTDAKQVDPPTAFEVTAVSLDAGVTVDD